MTELKRLEEKFSTPYRSKVYAEISPLDILPSKYTLEVFKIFSYDKKIYFEENLKNFKISLKRIGP